MKRIHGKQQPLTAACDFPLSAFPILAFPSAHPRAAHHQLAKPKLSWHMPPFARSFCCPGVLRPPVPRHLSDRDRHPNHHALPGLACLRRKLGIRMRHAKDLLHCPGRRDLRQDRPGSRGRSLLHSRGAGNPGPASAVSPGLPPPSAVVARHPEGMQATQPRGLPSSAAVLRRVHERRATMGHGAETVLL